MPGLDITGHKSLYQHSDALAFRRREKEKERRKRECERETPGDGTKCSPDIKGV